MKCEPVELPPGVVNGGQVLASYELPQSPAWATERRVDEAITEHSYLIGTVGTCGDDPALDVRVIQLDYLDLRADPPMLTRLRPEIRLGQIRLSEEQSHELGLVLIQGADLVAAVTGCSAET